MIKHAYRPNIDNSLYTSDPLSLVYSHCIRHVMSSSRPAFFLIFGGPRVKTNVQRREKAHDQVMVGGVSNMIMNGAKTAAGGCNVFATHLHRFCGWAGHAEHAFSAETAVFQESMFRAMYVGKMAF